MGTLHVFLKFPSKVSLVPNAPQLSHLVFRAYSLHVSIVSLQLRSLSTILEYTQDHNLKISDRVFDNIQTLPLIKI